jgi:hypothetical protein
MAKYVMVWICFVAIAGLLEGICFSNVLDQSMKCEIEYVGVLFLFQMGEMFLCCFFTQMNQ